MKIFPRYEKKRVFTLVMIFELQNSVQAQAESSGILVIWLDEINLSNLFNYYYTFKFFYTIFYTFKNWLFLLESIVQQAGTRTCCEQI